MQTTTAFGMLDHDAHVSSINKPKEQWTDAELAARIVSAKLCAKEYELIIDALDQAYNYHRREGSMETAREYEELHRRQMTMLAVHQANILDYEATLADPYRHE